MPIIKYTFILLSFQLSANLFAQKQTDSIYSSANMVSDFKYLHTHLFLNHPGIYKYTNKQTWDSVYQITLKQLQQPLQDIKFRMVLRNYLSYSKCGHTQVVPSKKSIKNFDKRKHFTPPFKVAFFNNKIIVTDNESDDSSLIKGTEILSINGNSADDIMMNIFAVQNSDAGLQSMKNFYGALQFPSFYMAIYGEDSVHHLNIMRLNGDNQTISVKHKKTENKKQKPAKIKFNLFDQKLANFRICKGDTQTAILKIKGFQLRNANKLYSKAFEQMAEKEIKYLILDLRGNGGGSIVQASELISYIAKDTFSYGFARGKQGLTYKSPFMQKVVFYASKIMIDLFGNRKTYNNEYNYLFQYDKSALKKEKHFDGAVFCLIDNGSFSAASFVAAYAKYKVKAILVGQETAGTESGCYAVNTPYMELPITKNFIRIPHYQFKHILPIVYSNRGVIPSIPTFVNATTINSENDEEMDLIWKLILENQK